MKFNRILIVVFAIIFLENCQETDTSYIPFVPDYSYFPLDSGAWREFQVQTINIDEPSAIYDTFNYYLREVFIGKYIDNSGDTLTKIERFTRSSTSENWTPANTWLAIIKDNMAIQTEENTRYIKLRFPVELDKEWDGNAYNRTDTLKKFKTYTIESIDVPLVLNSILFDSVLTVLQRNELTNISKIVFFEKYAKHIGMVQKQEIDIYSEEVDLNTPIEKRVTRGTFYYANLISYGK
jgi:hypothetical protein